MSARAPRRTFAHPFVITLAAAPACGPSRPPHANPPPPPAPADPATTATAPAPAPDPAPAPAPMSDDDRAWVLAPPREYAEIPARTVERDFVPRFAARDIRVSPGAVIEV